jgi:hypothetical protein
LAFLSTLAPSERYARECGKRHKKLTEWAWQLLLQLRRWQPEREIVAVADGTYAALELLDRCRRISNPITFITRLRLDAALYEAPPPRRPGQLGRPRLKGERLPNLSMVAQEQNTIWKAIRVANWYGARERIVEVVSDRAIWYSTGLPAVPVRWVLVRDPHEEFKTQALLCTDLDAKPEQIISWFVRRWQLEATFQEARQRLGFETQRHWSEKAIRRSAPALLALFSFVTLFAHQHMTKDANALQCTANGLVRQEASDLLRRSGGGTQRVMGRRADFVRVLYGRRDAKSPAGVYGQANRCALLRSLMAKVQLYELR